jgi:predicted aspartyl protease
MPTRYLSQNFPLPIPALPVTIGSMEERPWLGPFQALVDSGADLTIFPLPLLQRIKAHVVGAGRLRSPWGEALSFAFYMVEMQIDDLLLPGVRVAGAPRIREIILGRNVLNKLPLFLDGPEQQTTVLNDTAAKRLRA